MVAHPSRVLEGYSSDHHSCNKGTPRQEVKTASSGLPDIQKEDTCCKGLSEEGSRAETAQGW